MSKNNQILRITSLIVVFTFIFSFARPMSVYAQDEQPVEPAPTEEVAVPEESAPAEVLELLPEEVDLVVLNATGEQLPLASTEASDALKGLLNNNIASFYCDGQQVSYTTIANALIGLDSCKNGNLTVGGPLTIVAGTFNESIYIDTAYAGFTGIQGAGSGQTFLTGISLINQTADITVSGLTIYNPGVSNPGTHAISSNGVDIITTGDITVDDVVVGAPAGDLADVSGMSLDAGGNIQVTDSAVYDSSDVGFAVEADGNITMSGIVVDDAGRGIFIGDADAVGLSQVVVGTTSLNGIQWDNSAAADGATDSLVLTDVKVNYTDLDALDVWNVGTVNINATSSSDPSEFSNTTTDGYGIYLEDVGNVSISDTEALDNSYTGIYIYGADSVSISSSNAMNNAIGVDCDVAGQDDCTGITILNTPDITIDGGLYSGNAYSQIQIDNTDLYDGNADPIESTVSVSSLVLDGSVIEAAQTNGIWSDYSWDNLRIGGNENQSVTITDVETRNSFCDGIYMWNNATVDLSGIASHNNGWGDECTGTLIEDSDNVTVADSTYENNYIGMSFDNVLDVAVSGTTISGTGIEQEGDEIADYTTGIKIDSAMSASIQDTTITDGAYGIESYEVDDLGIAGAQISNFLNTGIDIEYANSATISDTTINGGRYGIDAYYLDDLSITGTTIDEAKSNGLYLDEIMNTLTLTNVKVSNSGESGAYIVVDGVQNMVFNCTTFEYNGVQTDYPGFEAYGLNDVTLAGVTFTGNGADGLSEFSMDWSGNLIEFTDCIGQSNDPIKQPGVSGHIVPVTSGQSVAVECGYGFTSLVLGTGDTAAFDGFCGSDAAFSQVESASLPGALTEGWTFISAFTETVDGSTDGILPDGGSAELNLAAGGNPSSLAVLYWDAGAKAWVEIPVVGGEGSFSASNPAYKVLTGVTYTADGTARFSVNFTGTFVVVRK
jgi:parallel beta-helix repeat protein